VPNAETTVRDFFAEISAGGRLVEAFDRYLSEDCVWENTGLPTANGKAAVMGMLQVLIKDYRLHALVIEIRTLAVIGDTVLTERIDHMDDVEGRRLLTFPLAGILQVQSGKIVRWSDYFDPRDLLSGVGRA
jgi:limonene-1,2-epoxide hydrolase